MVHDSTQKLVTTLSNGVKMPLVGLGTWQAKNAEEIESAVRTALDVGYRLIDTAWAYQNEASIGKVLHEYLSSGKIKRDELFVTTKLFYNAHKKNDVEKMLRESLAALQLDYVDLYLIHAPLPFKRKADSWAMEIENGKMVPETTDILETWSAMEDIYKKGLARSIGISNFNKAQIQRLYDNAHVKPQNLQVECHLHFPQHSLHDLCKKLDMSMTAYAPIGSPGRKAFRPDGEWPEGECIPLEEKAVLDIAKKHAKTPAQVLLRQLVQRGICVIPKSTNEKRLTENFQIGDFTLDEADMKALDSVKTHVRLFVAEYAAHHPFYKLDDD